MFKWVVGLSALVIAGCAAFFSVTGIALLFSGATLSVAIMAGSLELGKLVAASYLHRMWDKINWLFRIYFTSAVVILVFITSMGIFGFLSNAYQKTSLAVQNVDSQVNILDVQRTGLETDISRFQNRIDVLTNQRSSQESRYDSLVAGENWVNARRTFELIESADTEIRGLNNQITESRQKLNDLNIEILTIQTDNIDLAREIGGFKFIAEAFDVPIDTAVKWFIIMLIFVFDPLAVSLVIAWNKLIDDKDYDMYIKKVKEKLVSDEETSYVSDIIDESKKLGMVAPNPQKAPNTKKI
jgi:chaperonin cofactor prefoldin